MPPHINFVNTLRKTILAGGYRSSLCYGNESGPRRHVAAATGHWFPNINHLDGDPAMPEGIVEAGLLDYFTDLHLCWGVSIVTHVDCDFVSVCGVEEAIVAVLH